MSETTEGFVARMHDKHLRCEAMSFEDGNRIFALALRGAAMQWRPIDTPPEKPMPVLFYCAAREFDGVLPSYRFPSYRDEKYDIGFWDGESWRWNDTGHLVFEWPENVESDDSPTHYMPLPAPPASLGAQSDE